MDNLALKKFVEENPKLVSMKPAGDGIFILKYKNSVFYDNLWNEFLEECRGTIVDSDFNVVTRPFTKIYNYGIEARAPRIALSTPVRAYRKVNGFMVALTWWRDDILVSTTGTTDSEYVALARETMLTDTSWERWQSFVRAQAGRTLMFECVNPSDPHIVPEEAGMYFLGWRDNTWDSKVEGFTEAVANQWRGFAMSIGCKFAESFECSLGDLVAESKRVKHEGFVWYAEDGTTAKIKTPYYLTNKFVARCKNTDKLMRQDIKKNLDEEYYTLIDAIQSDIQKFSEMDEQARLAWVREFLSA